MSDPVARSDDLDRQLLVLRRADVLPRRTVIGGFMILCVLLAAILAGIVAITSDTNQAVERQVVPLQRRVAELEETVADQDSIVTQQTDAIVLLLGILQENGITAPEIIIRPPED